MSKKNCKNAANLLKTEGYNNISIEKICKDLAPYAKYANKVKSVNEIGTPKKNVFKEK